MDPKKAKQILNNQNDGIPNGKARSNAAFKKMNQKKWNDAQRRLKLQQLFKKIQDTEE